MNTIAYTENLRFFTKVSEGNRLLSSYFTYMTLSSKKTYDRLKSGGNACAWVVSTILTMIDYVNLLERRHQSCKNLEANMISKNWEEVSLDEIEVGCVIFWEELNGHRHVGLYVDKNNPHRAAFSNLSSKGVPGFHSIDFNGTRNIDCIYKHQKFTEDKERSQLT